MKIMKEEEVRLKRHLLLPSNTFKDLNKNFYFDWISKRLIS